MNFVVNDKNYAFDLDRKPFVKQNLIWNPDKDDLLFFQTFSMLDMLGEEKIQTFRKKCKIVISIYDIFPITDPEWFKGLMSESFKRIFGLAWNNADCLIVNCKQTEREIEAYMQNNYKSLGNSDPRIKIVNLWGVATPSLETSKKLIVNSKRVSNLFQNSDPILILVSTVEPRKGHKELIDAATQAWNQGAKFNLLFVGQLGWISKNFKSELEDFLDVEKDRALWFSRVGDEELEKYINSSDLLISPSLGEGYGLPVAEALQRNLPVLANGIDSYKELFEKHVVLYGPEETYSSLTEALADISNVIVLARDLISLNELPKIDTFSQLLESIGEI